MGTSIGLPGHVAAAVGKAQDLHWAIGLARSFALQLDLRAGVGEAELDLSQLRLDSGVGKVALMLPAGRRCEVDIRAGVGAIALTVPAGGSGRLRIKGGVGQMRIEAATGSAIRLKGKAGLATIDLPERMIQVEGGRVTGTWQSDNFETAKRQIDIDYVGGVGRFALAFVESK